MTEKNPFAVSLGKLRWKNSAPSEISAAMKKIAKMPRKSRKKQSEKESI